VSHTLGSFLFGIPVSKHTLSEPTFLPTWFPFFFPNEPDRLPKPWIPLIVNAYCVFALRYDEITCSSRERYSYIVRFSTPYRTIPLLLLLSTAVQARTVCAKKALEDPTYLHTHTHFPTQIHTPWRCPWCPYAACLGSPHAVNPSVLSLVGASTVTVPTAG
jgi:hypothetical protein